VNKNVMILKSNNVKDNIDNDGGDAEEINDMNQT